MESSDNPKKVSSWTERLSDFLVRDSAAMAAEWDKAKTEFSLATIGRVNEAALRQTLESVLSGPHAGSRQRDR